MLIIFDDPRPALVLESGEELGSTRAFQRHADPPCGCKPARSGCRYEPHCARSGLRRLEDCPQPAFGDNLVKVETITIFCCGCDQTSFVREINQQH